MLLASCSGVSYYLTTGEALKAFVLALLLGGLLTLLVVVLPVSDRWRGSQDFYMLAVVVLVFPWVMLKIGYTGRHSRNRPVWHDLRARYAATGPTPDDLYEGRDVVVSRVRRFQVQLYGYKPGAPLTENFPTSHSSACVTRAEPQSQL